MYKKTLNHRAFFCISFLLCGIFATSAFSQNSYEFSVKVEKQTVYVDLNVKLDSAKRTFTFNDSAEISKIKTPDGQAIQYRRDSSTLVLDSEIREFEISYTLDKKTFSLDDGTLMLKKEGAWYPSVSNMSFTSKLNIEHDQETYYVVSGGYISAGDYNLDFANEVSLILLPMEYYTNQKYTISDIEYQFYHYPDKILPEDMMRQFTDAASFFSDFFSDTPFNALNVVFLGPDNLQYAQSLNGIVIFDNFFTDLHVQNPKNSWIPHEVAHQWWGKSVLFDSEAQLYRFLEESFTEYLKTEFVKHSYSDSVYASVFQTYKNSCDYVLGDNSKRLSIRDVRRLDNQENSIIIYCKGTLVLQKIIEENDVNFKNFMRNFYHKFKGKQVSYFEFYNAFKEFSSSGAKALDIELQSHKKIW